MSVVFIHSHYGPVPPVFEKLAAQGRVKILRDSALGNHEISTASGIITTMHLDQVAFFLRKDAITAFFRNGGRLFFNGHILKPFVDGLENYRPLMSKRLADFQLCTLAPHPVFQGYDPQEMVTRKGVAGFYGRGYNPAPKRARLITGLGTLRQPVDWEWDVPLGGQMFSHAGNDLWSMAPKGAEGTAAFAERIVRWAAGRFAMAPV